MPYESRKKLIAAQKSPLTGLLRKAIHVDDVKPRGLRLVLGAPPDASDILAFVEDERRKRFAELDKFFELQADGDADIWQQRANALVAYQFDVGPRDPHWWRTFTEYLV